jgi:hypothetical protein
MNREIKFRVWDKASQNFLLSEVSGKHPFHFVGALETYSIESSHPDYVFQQYTGRKDENEQEIYEGDIVWLNFAHAFESWGKENNRFEIVFYRGAFQLKPIKLSKPQGFGIGGGNGQFSHLVEIVGHDEDDDPIYEYRLPPPQPLCDFNICVVMGNIFENPELKK